MPRFPRKRRFPHIKRLFFGERGKNVILFSFVLIPNAVSAIFEGLSFGLILLALKAFNQPGPVEIPFAPHFLNSWLHSLPNQDTFIALLALAIGLQVVRSAVSYGGSVVMLFLGARIQIMAQMAVYRQILSLSFPCASRYKTGDLLEYAKIPALLVASLLDPLNQLIVSGFMIVMSFTIMLTLSPALSGLAIFIFGTFGIMQRLVIAKVSSTSEALAAKTVNFSKDTVQNLHALRTIHSFNRQEAVLGHTLHNLGEIAAITTKINLWGRSILPVTEMVGIILVGFFLLVGKWLATSAGNPLPILLTFIMVIHRLNARAQLFLSSATTLASHWGYILRLEEILDETGKDFSPRGQRHASSFSQEIRFDHTSLQYEASAESALCELCLSIRKGSTVAFVGSSGAGKSSLLDLLLKLYNPTSGRIWIDGTDLQDLDPGSWRDQLGVVSQDTFIFNETIADNIRFGCLEASKTMIVDAASQAGAHEFISRLPDGYETVVGERGYRLSGGERQRIALARALIRKPEILILDEATSNLDSFSEHKIQKALDSLHGQKTIIIVAHRLSTIFNADQIFVLDRGRLVESGTHLELLNLQGKYASLWTLQCKEKAPETTVIY